MQQLDGLEAFAVEEVFDGGAGGDGGFGAGADRRPHLCVLDERPGHEPRGDWIRPDAHPLSLHLGCLQIMWRERPGSKPSKALALAAARRGWMDLEEACSGFSPSETIFRISDCCCGKSLDGVPRRDLPDGRYRLRPECVPAAWHARTPRSPPPFASSSGQPEAPRQFGPCFECGTPLDLIF